MADKMLRMAGRDPRTGMAKAIKTDSEGNIGIVLNGSETLEVEQLPVRIQQVVGIEKNSLTLYGVDKDNRRSLLKSTDKGKTWVAENTFSDLIMRGTTTMNDSLLVWINNRELWRKPKDGTWARVLTDVYAPLHGGVHVRTVTNQVMFGEYTTATHSGLSVWQSKDDGVTWSKSLADIKNIRHFHTAIFNPLEGAWYASSGDADSEVFIWRSGDLGNSWQVVANGKQKYRTLGHLFTEQLHYWIMDSQDDKASVIRANVLDQTDNEVAFKLNTAGFVLDKISDDFWFAAEMSEAPGRMGRNARMYASRDRGQTWNTVMNLKLLDPTHTMMGFQDAIGPDVEGWYYISARGLHPYDSMIRFRPKTTSM